MAKALRKLTKRQTEKRDGLIHQYTPYVNAIASKVYRVVPSEIDYNDLVSYGKMGLLEAATRFDPKYKVDFKTFAYYRINFFIIF